MGYGKPGRPRSEGERWPSGKLKPPADTERKPITGALWQRMMADGEKIFGDARFGTELSRLGATGALRPGEVAAGIRVAGIYGRFEYYQNRSRSTASPHYIREMVAEGAGTDTEFVNFRSTEGRERDRGWMGDDERAIREREATAAFKELQDVIPVPFRQYLEALCVENRHIGFDALQGVKVALGMLREFFFEKDHGKGTSRRDRRKPRRMSNPEPIPEKAVRINPLKAAFLAMQRRLSPHLSDDDLEKAWSVLCALKDRNDFHLAKSAKTST